MKTKSLIVAFAVLLGSSALISCDSKANTDREVRSEENLKQEEVSTLEIQKRKQASLDSAKYVTYKSESEAKIAENDNMISELKKKIKSDRKKIKKDYKKAVAELEKRNDIMKVRMREAGKDIKKDWKAFKKDLDDLGKSIADMAEKDTKKKKS